MLKNTPLALSNRFVQLLKRFALILTQSRKAKRSELIDAVGVSRSICDPALSRSDLRFINWAKRSEPTDVVGVSKIRLRSFIFGNALAVLAIMTSAASAGDAPDADVDTKTRAGAHYLLAMASPAMALTQSTQAESIDGTAPQAPSDATAANLYDAEPDGVGDFADSSDFADIAHPLEGEETTLAETLLHANARLANIIHDALIERDTARAELASLKELLAEANAQVSDVQDVKAPMVKNTNFSVMELTCGYPQHCTIGLPEGVHMADDPAAVDGFINVEWRRAGNRTYVVAMAQTDAPEVLPLTVFTNAGPYFFDIKKSGDTPNYFVNLQ